MECLGTQEIILESFQNTIPQINLEIKNTTIPTKRSGKLMLFT